jgi:hypothetical protein
LKVWKSVVGVPAALVVAGTAGWFSLDKETRGLLATFAVRLTDGSFTVDVLRGKVRKARERGYSFLDGAASEVAQVIGQQVRQICTASDAQTGVNGTVAKRAR